MTGDFERAAEITVAYEGPYSNDPDDPGGLTRWGIAQRAHPEIDVATLTFEGAIEILRTEYWIPSGCERLPWPLCGAVFDYAVHQGAPTAIGALQGASGAPVDGIFGVITLARAGLAWHKDPRGLLARVLRARIMGFIANGNPRYLAGWVQRVTDLGLRCGMELEARGLGPAPADAQRVH